MIPPLEEVAKVYLWAPKNPTAAVRVHFDVPQSTAARWVSKARAAGLLAPTSPRSPGRYGKGMHVARRFTPADTRSLDDAVTLCDTCHVPWPCRAVDEEMWEALRPTLQAPRPRRVRLSGRAK